MRLFLTIPSTYIPPTATLDESILASTGDSSVSNKQPTVSMTVTDSLVIFQPPPLPETSPEVSDAANVDDTLVVQPNFRILYATILRLQKNVVLLSQPVGPQDT